MIDSSASRDKGGKRPHGFRKPAPQPCYRRFPDRTTRRPRSRCTRLGTSSRDWLAKLLRDEFRGVWRLVRRFGVPSASADDAAQEVFIIAARKLDEIEIGHERRYLFGIAIRVAANARRARARRPDQADSDALAFASSELPLSDALLDQKRMRELSDSVLDAMPLELRTAFVLFELEGFSVPEIAEFSQSRSARPRRVCGVPANLSGDRNATEKSASRRAEEHHDRPRAAVGILLGRDRACALAIARARRTVSRAVARTAAALGLGTGTLAVASSATAASAVSGIAKGSIWGSVLKALAIGVSSGLVVSAGANAVFSEPKPRSHSRARSRGAGRGPAASREAG